MPPTLHLLSSRDGFKSFTRAPDLNDGHGFDETKLTRFNVFAHQPTWTHSRLSCPPDSAARALEEEDRRDDVSRYGLGELGFVYNVTAMSDVCHSPSLSGTFGFDALRCGGRSARCVDSRGPRYVAGDAAGATTSWRRTYGATRVRKRLEGSVEE